MVIDFLPVNALLWYESDACIIEIPGCVETPRLISPNANRFEVPNFILSDSIASFAGITTAFFKIFPNPDVKWISFRNFYNPTIEQWKRGYIVSLC